MRDLSQVFPWPPSISSFDFLPYTVNLLYQPTLLNSAQEALVVLIGPLTNIVFFILLVILAWVIQKVELVKIPFLVHPV